MGDLQQVSPAHPALGTHHRNPAVPAQTGTQAEGTQAPQANPRNAPGGEKGMN